MFDIDGAIDELNLYCDLEWRLDCAIDRLNYVINNLQYAENGISRTLKIDSNRIDNNEISDIKNKLIGYREYLSTTCKDATINSKNNIVNTIENNGYEIIWG